MITARYRDKIIHSSLLGIVLIFAFPAYATAQVVISEIAWMGSISDANNEWIELHNTEGAGVNVTGWTLTVGSSFTITLEGSIPAGDYALLERTDDDSVPGVTMFQKYTGALPNTGATLTLKDSSGVEVDAVRGGDNWGSIGGNNDTKDTPQRTGAGSWVTSAPTPGRVNATSGSATGTVTESRAQTTSSGRRGGGGVVMRGTASQPRIEPEPLAVSITAPTIAYVNQAISFEAEPFGPGKTILNSLEHTWSFGDTFTGNGKTTTHAFTFAGEYTVVLESRYAKQLAQARHEISILPASLTLSRGQKGEVIIKNLSAHEIDLGGFTLLSDTRFVFPKFTIIKQGGALAVPPMRVAGQGTGIALLDTHGTVVASVETVSKASAPRLSSPARTVSTQGNQATVAATNIATTTTVSPSPVPSGVIRIGNDAAVPEQGKVGGFFARLARMLGL